ncbi:MAG: hypothetical protein NTY20_01260 [Candidatus Aenigmarchaeota archaeon]|nr:hypothetical protein [Candidatus Aenigmarchaeota archaeon]
MNVDWAVAVSVFLIFVGIGMAYYWGLFETNSNPVGTSLDIVNKKILDFLIIDSWKVPVRYNSSGSGLAVLYLDFSWPEGTKNSTRILDSGLPLSCMFQGDRLYFQANVQEGDNDFLMTFSNTSSPLACNSALETANSNASLPLASERSISVSQSNIDYMLATDYSQFRQSLGITRNFRVEIDSGIVSFLGPQPPAFTNTYVKESRYLIQETGQPVTVRVMVW